MAQLDGGATKHNQVQEAAEVGWRSTSVTQKEAANDLKKCAVHRGICD